MRAKRYFLMVLLAVVLWRACFAEEAAQPPVKYELKLVSIFEGKEPEFIFVIGNAGFKSIERLKIFLGRLPKGSEVTWNPGCDRVGNEPLLSSEEEMRDLRAFLEEKGIKFALVPSG